TSTAGQRAGAHHACDQRLHWRAARCPRGRSAGVGGSALYQRNCHQDAYFCRIDAGCRRPTCANGAPRSEQRGSQPTSVASERKWSSMKALVVYESMFGNTEQIARAVAAGLEESVDVQVAEVTDAPTEPEPDVALI